MERLQFRADGVSAQVFQLETKLNAVQTLEKELAHAQQGLQQAPTVEGLGLIPDIVERAKGFSALVAKVDETLAKLEAERQVDVVKSPTATPLQHDARFWAGMALGAASLFTGASLTGPLKYIALLDIPAFGLAALVALKRVEDLQWAELAVRRGDRLGDREKQVREQFETEAQPVRNAMKILGVEQPHEIVHALEEHPRWVVRVADVEKRLQAARLHPEYVAASTQLAELRAEQESLNAKLAEKGSYVRDARDVEREMARMREALAPAPRRVSSPGVPAAQDADGLDDFTPGLMNAAAESHGHGRADARGPHRRAVCPVPERADRPARGGAGRHPRRSGPRARGGEEGAGGAGESRATSTGSGWRCDSRCWSDW